MGLCPKRDNLKIWPFSADTGHHGGVKPLFFGLGEKVHTVAHLTVHQECVQRTPTGLKPAMLLLNAGPGWHSLSYSSRWPITISMQQS